MPKDFRHPACHTDNARVGLLAAQAVPAVKRGQAAATADATQAASIITQRNIC
jgi:hypothetical protein